MQAISQGELELVRFDTNAVLREIQRTLFPKITSEVTCNYGHIPTLGFVEKVGENRHVISLHSMFNHPDTPELVIRHILIHELLHIEVPPRDLREGEVDPRISRKKGREEGPPLGPILHPAEFWVRKWRREFGRRVVRPTIEQIRAGISEDEKRYPGMDGGE